MLMVELQVYSRLICIMEACAIYLQIRYRGQDILLRDGTYTDLTIKSGLYLQLVGVQIRKLQVTDILNVYISLK